MIRKYMYLWILAIPIGCATVPPEPPPHDTGPMSAQRAEALLQTLLALGVDYRYGGKAPDSGFDCSGLVAHVFREAYGIELPHNARAQSEMGVRVSLSELRAGDLVFYNTLNRPFSHVGIYLGDGRFVHAPKTGAQVRVEPISGRYWMRRFDGARRIRATVL
jgi:cell wall-associated NlpC family hydrolase